MDSEALQKKHYERIHAQYEAHYDDTYSKKYRSRFIYTPLFKDIELSDKSVLEAMCGSGQTTEYLLSKGRHIIFKVCLMSNSLLEAKLLTYLREKHWEGFAERLRYRMELHFRSLPLENHSVLEIGAGPGFLSSYCAARGAARVVALEPQAAGSSGNPQSEFGEMSALLELDDIVDYRNADFEQFSTTYKGKLFDYILMCAVVNHLNEDATTRLHLADSHADRELYLSYFRRMHELLAPGGSLILSDVGRKNFWGLVGIKFFIGKSIEWHKHQQPKIWRKLLAEAGFDSISLRWYTLYRLRKFAFLFARKLPAYFLNSAFVMTARKNGS